MEASVTAGPDRQPWVNRLSLIVLTLMLLYVIIGIPEDRDAAQALATDSVNPFNRFIWLGLLAMSIPVAIARWREVLRLAAACWPLLVLYLYFAASTRWALDPDASTRRVLFTVVQLIISLVLLCGVRRAASLHVLIAVVCIGAAAADLAAWVLAPGYAMTDEGLAGLQLQKNQTGLLMMYGCLSATSGYFLLPGRPWRLGMAGSVAMMALLLVATKSTTSQSIILLAPVVVPAVLLVARLSRSWMWALALGALAAVVALLLGYVAWCGLMNADPLAPTRGMTFTGRTDLWSFTWGQIQERPWFGAGYASLWSIDPAVQPSLKTDTWFGLYAIINEAHEGYLDLLAEGGIVGFVLGLFVVFRTLGRAGMAVARAEGAAEAWRSGRLAYPTAAFYLALLIGLLVHNFTESNLFSNNSVLAVAFVLAAIDLEKWRLAMWQPASARYPHPGARRATRPAALAGAGGPAARTPSTRSA